VSKTSSQPRCCAIVGSYLSGKTSLLEEILFTTGAISRKGNIKQGNTVGDSSPEARAHSMTTQLNIATTSYLDDEWTFIDCPGSVEFMQDTYHALMICDIAIVVCDPSPEKAITIAPVLKFLDDRNIPHMVFINKMDQPEASVRDLINSLQDISTRPLLLREIPIREKGEITGYVDLVSERAYKWQDGERSKLIKMPQTVIEREQNARSELLESLADFDDTLLEELLEDIQPSQNEIYDNIHKDLAVDCIVPVFFGSAEHRGGIIRLLKSLRHDTPDAKQSATRLGLTQEGVKVQVFKTIHAAHAGKLTFARVWSGPLKDSTNLNTERVAGIQLMLGNDGHKINEACIGQVVALGRLENTIAGQILSEEDATHPSEWPAPLPPMYCRAIQATKRADEVKLSAALAKLNDEDPSLIVEQNQVTGQLLLRGQGDMHLKIAQERLRERFAMAVEAHPPKVAYKESIRKSATKHARHRKQSGGHGEYGDVHIEISPLPRGSGFAFNDTITGGSVPKQYIPAVETGVLEYMQKGPLGFPVVDISVVLIDGGFHSVDSSEMAFKKAAHSAMRDAMPDCAPVLLEPIHHVRFQVPNLYTSKVQRLISGHRGQILGFDAKEGWKAWDEVSALIPEAELHELILELRSQTLGIGSYIDKFDHLQELSGKQADQVVLNNQ